MNKILILPFKIFRRTLIGALVNKNVDNYSIVGGVPAKHISYRFTNDQITEHENILKSKH